MLDNKYILYPDKELPRFDVKNNIDSDRVKESALLTKLLADDNRQVIEKDIQGVCHFNGTFNNADSLKKALSELPESYSVLVEKDTQ